MKPLIQSIRKFAAAGIAVAALSLGAGSALAQQGPGVTDTEIKIGAYLPLSGPIASYGIQPATSAAMEYENIIGEAVDSEKEW